MYGTPNLERFEALTSVDLTAEYGSDGRAYHAVIDPRESSLVSAEEAAEVLDDVVPLNLRGGPSHVELTRSSCKTTESTSYKNVTIGRITYCDPDGGPGTHSIDVTFNEPLGPTSVELHARYGEPDSERFQARLGINLTVDYGSDGLACDMRFAPSAKSSPPNDDGKLFPQGVSANLGAIPADPGTEYLTKVTEILNEAVPKSVRGARVTAMGAQASCGVAETEDFENVSISTTGSICTWGGTNVHATFKRAVCQHPRK